LLRWRIIIGTFLVAVLLGLCRLDLRTEWPGVYLLPLAMLLCILGTEELMAIFRSAGHACSPWAVRTGVLLTVLIATLPIARVPLARWLLAGNLGYLAMGLAAGLLVILLAELAHYTHGGHSLAKLAYSAFALMYLGGLLGFIVHLRLLPVRGDVARGGMLAMFSMIAVVKFTDIGAYIAGRAWGRHKMAPVLSPGKTLEGAAGGLVLAVLTALVVLGPVATKLGLPSPHSPARWWVGAVTFGLLVGLAGMVGDLAESLLKREAGVKDSSTWLPGFGGVLDLVDSLLVAAPVAYVLWVLGVV
jgi:phosphatidate cytidylyltransferase